MSSTIILLSSDDEVENDEDDDVQFLGSVPPPTTDADEVVCIGVFPHQPKHLGKIETVMEMDEGKWLMSQASHDEVEVVFMGNVNGGKEEKKLPSRNVSYSFVPKSTSSPIVNSNITPRPASMRRNSLLATPPSLPASISPSVKITPKPDSLRNPSFPSDSMTSIIIMNKKKEFQTTINIGHVSTQKRAQLQFLGPLVNLQHKSEVSIRKVVEVEREPSPELLQVDDTEPEVQIIGTVLKSDNAPKEEPLKQIGENKNIIIGDGENIDSPGCSSSKRKESDCLTEDESSQENEETEISLGEDAETKSNDPSSDSDSNSSVCLNDSSSSEDNGKPIDVIFDKFIKYCKCDDNSEKLEIAKSKLRKYFAQSTSQVLSGVKLRTLLESSISRLKEKSGEHCFVHMKKVLDLLKSQHQETEKKVKKLEKFLEKINKKIKTLEEAEVTSSSEEDSSYIQVDRYKRKAVLIYSKICELKSVPADAERVYLRKISFPAPELNEGSSKMMQLCDSLSKTLQNYFNSTRKFPDFQDVKSTAKKICSKKDITLSPDKLHFVCQKVFEAFASMLQRRRMFDDYTICREYINSDCEDDPAKSDPLLAQRLSTNATFRSREQQVLQKYTLLELESKQKAVEEDSKEPKTCESKKENSKNKKRKKNRTSSNSSSEDSHSNKKSEHRSRKRTKDKSDSE